MGFGLPLFSPPLLVLACEGCLQNSPSPQEFALGPTCLVVKGRDEGNSLDFLSSIVFLFCFRRERTQQKVGSVPVGSPPPSQEYRLLQTLNIGGAASAWWLAVVSRLFGWVLALQTFQLVPISRSGIRWQLRMASKTFPKKYLGYLVSSALWGKTSLPVSTLGSRARLAKPSMVQSRLLKPIGRQERTVLNVYLGYFTDIGGGFDEVGQAALVGPSWITNPKGATHASLVWAKTTLKQPDLQKCLRCVGSTNLHCTYNLLDPPRRPQPPGSCV